MAFIELLWKARTIEKYRQRYEKEKQNSIRLIDAQDAKKTFYQRIVNYNVTAKDRISKTLLKRYPKGSNVYNLCYYLKTDQTFPNFLLKSVIGFVGGIILTYLCFMFFVFQLSMSLIHATIMSSIIGVLLTLGLAFSYRVRCLVFLLLPQLFSRVGRYTLTCYALVLILTGPATNTLKNSEVLSESLACKEEQIKTTMRQIQFMEMKKPIVSMRETTKVLKDDINTMTDKMKVITLRLSRLILSLTHSIQSSYQWLASSCNRCNKKLGTPYARCLDNINDSIIQCQALLGPLFRKVCDFGKISKLACIYTMPWYRFCEVVEFGNTKVLEVVTTRLNTFTEHLNSIFNVELHVHHSITSSGNISRYPNQVPPGIVTGIRNKADLFLTWISWSSTITSASLLLIIFRAKYYQHMYETRSRFDNRYITSNLRELDMKRLHQGKETVLPLNRRERGKYIKTTSFRLVSSEKIHISRSAVTMAFTTFKLLIHMVADYSLYWVLMTIRMHGIKQTPLNPGLFDTSIYVTGTGLLSKIYQFFLGIISAPLRVHLVSPVTCLPNPHPPDFQRYTQIGVLIFLLWFFALFEPYGLRLRHVIMGHYRPERAKSRALWLYNHIQRTRGCFIKFARRKLHREYKYSSEESLTLRHWLDNNIPFSWLKYLLGAQPRDPHCVLCGVIENGYTLIRCRTPNCPGRFCTKCFQDLRELCTICLSPGDYGDLSDVSLEKGSSNDSGSDSDDENAPQSHQPHAEKTYSVVEMAKKKQRPKSSKQNKKEKRAWLFGKKKGNEVFDRDEDTDQDQIAEYLSDQVHEDDNENRTIKKNSVIPKEHYMRKVNLIRYRKLVKIEQEKNDINGSIVCSKYLKIYQFTGNINKDVVRLEKVGNSRRVSKDRFDMSLDKEDVNKISLTGSDLTQPTCMSDETVARLLRHFRMLRKYSVNRKRVDRKLNNLSCSITTISSSLWRTCFCTEIEELQEHNIKKNLQNKYIQENKLKLCKESSKSRLKNKSTVLRPKTHHPKYSQAQKLQCRETNAISIKASLLLNRMRSSKRRRSRRTTAPSYRVNRQSIDVMSEGDNSQKVDELANKREKDDLVPEQDRTYKNEKPLSDRDKDKAYYTNLAEIHKKNKHNLLKKYSSYILSKVCSSLHRPSIFMYKRSDISDENSRNNHKRRKKISLYKAKNDEKAKARAYRISTYLSDMDWVRRCKKNDSVCTIKDRHKVGAALIQDFITADEGNKVFLERESNVKIKKKKTGHKTIKPKMKNKKKLVKTDDIQRPNSSEFVIGEVNYENFYEASRGDDIEEEAALNPDTIKSQLKLNQSKPVKKKEYDKAENNLKGHMNIKKSKIKRVKKGSVIQPDTAKDVNFKIKELGNKKRLVEPKRSLWSRLFRKKKQTFIVAQADAEITVKPYNISCSVQGSNKMQVSKTDKEVTAPTSEELPSKRKKHHRNVCTYYNFKSKTKNTFGLTETSEGLTLINPKTHHKKHEKRTILSDKMHHEINEDHKSTQTKCKVLTNTEVQCESKLKSSTPKAVKFADSNIPLTRCPSVSSIFSNAGTKSDTSVYSVIVGYADDRHNYDRSIIRRSKMRPLQLISKENQATCTDVKTVCDVGTATHAWWSPIMDRKVNKGTVSSPKRKENRYKKRNVGVYTKILDTQEVSTTNKVVTFNSHAQLIPPQPSNILSPSRYLLESQKYYNELFSDKAYSTFNNEEFSLNKKVLIKNKRSVSRTKPLEEIQIGRRRLKYPHVLENVWTASDSTHKRFAINNSDSSLNQRKRYRTGRKQIATKVSRHRHQRNIDEKLEPLKVKVRLGEVLLYSAPSLSKDDLSTEVQCPSNPSAGSF